MMIIVTIHFQCPPYVFLIFHEFRTNSDAIKWIIKPQWDISFYPITSDPTTLPMTNMSRHESFKT